MENNDTKQNYMMLGRLQMDCLAFINYSNGNTNRLYYKGIKEHIAAMKELYNNFMEKPVWCTMEQINQYEKDMLSA